MGMKRNYGKPETEKERRSPHGKVPPTMTAGISSLFTINILSHSRHSANKLDRATHPLNPSPT